MDALSEIRKTAGKRITVGLPDYIIEKFLAKDVNLAAAIQKAHKIWQSGELSNKEDEEILMEKIQEGFCIFYPENTRNPYIPSAAKGPWIVTVHGAVIHDNGGYGMLGFGHSPDAVMEAMSQDVVMANIMTPSAPQQKFITAIRKEIGHNRKGGCPYSNFVLMNSGSEGNSVATRVVDSHTGHVAGNRQVKGVSLVGSFHGRTYKPALLTDSCSSAYKRTKTYSIVRGKEGYAETVQPNDIEGMKEIFRKAGEQNWFIECVFLESVMGEGNPGQAITPEFYKVTRELTLEHDSFLLVDNIQAGLRCTGNLSIVDYEGFESLPCPDFEVYSKAINAGQYPVSCVSFNDRAVQAYRHGTYGNTMTGNPRACLVACSVLNSITPELRENIVNMGKYAVQEYKKLQEEVPNGISKVSGTGLLYAVQLNKEIFEVVAVGGAEHLLRQRGIGVIHGGDNALRFTPHFKITKDEIDLQVDSVRDYLNRVPYQKIVELNARKSLIRAEDSSPTTPRSSREFTLVGHLFDRNAINQVLNVVEDYHGSATILRLQLGDTVHERSITTIQVRCREKLDDMMKKIQDLAKVMSCEFK